MITCLTLGKIPLTLGDLRRVADGEVSQLRPEQDALTLVDRSRALVDRLVDEGSTTYGVNTGFGPLSSVTIPADRLEEMQRRMILSHCVGTGPLLDDGTVRMAIVLKIVTLLAGRSGVRRDVVEALVDIYEAGIVPCIPAKGSVGASGDLAPLAHLAAALLGVGNVRVGSREVPALEALAARGLTPITLAPKEGLALVNGTQISLALALRGLFATERILAAAVVAGALATDAVRGSVMAFDPRIHRVRGQNGQTRVAAAYESLLAGSGLRVPPGEGRIQDPYSLRCQPQILGAAVDLIDFSAGVFGREIQAVTDNPLVFAEDDAILYGGNFHGQPIAMAADVLALAIAEIGNLAERQLALLVDASLSSLPPFLAVDPGVDSGFMLGQVAAAALASENKGVAHPASIDSLPTAANQEDIVSMATYAARRLDEMADNAAGILAIELLAATQGLEFRRPLRSSPGLEDAVALVRAEVPASRGDHYMHPEIAAVKSLVRNGAFVPFLPVDLLPSWLSGDGG